MRNCATKLQPHFVGGGPRARNSRQNRRHYPGERPQVENIAAELTTVVYPLVLRRGLGGSWIKVELGLWRALSETVRKWDRERPPAESSGEFEAWRESLLMDLTVSAFSVALNNGINGPFVELELGLYRALGLVIRRHCLVN